MSQTIRLSDSTYKRLEAHALGFDNPSNVIERLLDFYESHNKGLRKSNSELHETAQNIRRIRKSPISIKKPRDPEKEKQLREAVGRALKWGEFKLTSNTVLKFQNSPSKVLCKYSSYSPKQDR